MNICKNCLSLTATDLCGTCESANKRLKYYHSLSDDPKKLLAQLFLLKAQLKPNEKVLIGVSGGVDSSFIAAACGEARVPTQLIHFDNGWNTQLATQNINKLIDTYNFPLYTVVQHWGTFKSLQRSFLFSGVPDIELLSDHAIFATLVKYLKKNRNIRFVLSGSNFTTEHGLSPDYVWNKWDVKNIKDINKKFEAINIKKYPTIGILHWVFYRKMSKRRKILVPLNDFYYKRSVALDFLGSKINFIDYEYKHEESLLTKVFQRTILPRKYNYYKIEEHLSALIRNKEISQAEGFNRLNDFKSSTIDDYELSYFKAKLSLSDDEWLQILSEKGKRHDDYRNNKRLFYALASIGNRFKLRSMQ